MIYTPPCSDNFSIQIGMASMSKRLPPLVLAVFLVQTFFQNCRFTDVHYSAQSLAHSVKAVYIFETTLGLVAFMFLALNALNNKHLLLCGNFKIRLQSAGDRWQPPHLSQSSELRVALLCIPKQRKMMMMKLPLPFIISHYIYCFTVF